jgi:hypothetical protein
MGPEIEIEQLEPAQEVTADCNCAKVVTVVVPRRALVTEPVGSSPLLCGEKEHPRIEVRRSDRNGIGANRPDNVFGIRGSPLAGKKF